MSEATPEDAQAEAPGDPWTIAASVVPPAILAKIAHRPDRREAFCRDVQRHVWANPEALLRSTEVCLRNLPSERFGQGPDAALRIVLVPELWDRIAPGSRTYLRRITSSLADHDPGLPSLFRRMMSPDRRATLDGDADLLRAEIARVSALDPAMLVDRVRFAIAGSEAKKFEPAYPVYEPAFAYRLVPAIVHRMRIRWTLTG